MGTSIERIPLPRQRNPQSIPRSFCCLGSTEICENQLTAFWAIMLTNTRDATRRKQTDVIDLGIGTEWFYVQSTAYINNFYRINLPAAL